MENEAQDSNSERVVLIDSFCEITSSTKEEALFFLESHNWDLDSAVSTFYDNTASVTATVPSTETVANPIAAARSSPPSHSPNYSPSQSPSRSRSPSPSPSRAPYALRSRRADKKSKKKTSSSRSRGVRTIADLNGPASDESESDSDEPQELYTGGEKRKGNDVDSMFDQLAQSGAAREVPEHLQSSSNSKSFTGKARMLSGETVSGDPQPLESVTHSITFWRNGFSVNDGPLRRMDDPQNASFLESIKKSECPKELEPADRRTAVHVSLVKLDEEYPEPVKQRAAAFQGLGRTLGSSSSTPSAASEPTPAATFLNSAPLLSRGLVLDESLPLTSIQLRLADGTRMVSRFNNHHTIRDIRAFIDASRPGGPTIYQLQVMGFPPKQLTELDQTIEQAGIANSVVIQRL